MLLTSVGVCRAPGRGPSNPARSSCRFVLIACPFQSLLRPPQQGCDKASCRDLAGGMGPIHRPTAKREAELKRRLNPPSPHVSRACAEREREQAGLE